MPNIEIHSFKGDAVLDVVTNIKETVKDLPFAQEIVITERGGTCLDIKGNIQPFIRIYDSDPERMQELEDILKYIADVETVDLKSFTEKVKRPPVQEPKAP